MKAFIHAMTFIGGLMAAAFTLCALVGWRMGDAPAAPQAFLGLGALCFMGSLVAWRVTRTRDEIQRRDALLIVVSGWILAAVLGSLPYHFLSVTPDFASAFFESMSGLTTTGASVLSDLEQLPRAVLFWRSLTHFLGGVGILIMFIAILPFVGTGGVQLFKAESTGLFSEKLTPRIASTARIILGVYLLLNGLCAAALWLGGLSLYEAVCHAFATIATGGFSTRSASVAAFDSAYIEWVIIVFMFIGGTSFVLHFRALQGDYPVYFRSIEWRFFAILALAVSLLTAVSLDAAHGQTFMHRFRVATFQTVSLYSTTGFATADYDVWPIAIRLAFLVMMIIGASAGSTSGAIKGIRVVVAGKSIVRQMKVLLQPTRIQSLKIDGEVVETERSEKALVYIITYLLVLTFGALLLTTMATDIMTAFSAVVACLGGVGPGFAGVGPTQTYAHFPAAAKLLLSLLMWLGRLEIFVCLVVILPGFWKK